jgi:hypothetical protein
MIHDKRDPIRSLSDLKYKNNLDIIFDQPLQDIAQRSTHSENNSRFGSSQNIYKISFFNFGPGLATGLFVFDCVLYRKEIPQKMYHTITLKHDSTHDSPHKNLKLEIGYYVVLVLHIG